MEKNQSKPLPQFGNYETREWLGSGGGANTYLVEDTALHRYWVVKQIRHEFVTQDPKFEERFKQEAQMLASLNHPHIVEIHDFDPQQGYIVMPWAEGGTLRKLLDDDYPDGMTPKEALPILQQIGAGLVYAHEQPNPTNGQQKGILHLDLKPENILVKIKSGSWGKKDRQYLVADFGIARWMSKISGSPEGQSWFGIGTRGYRAPEQYIVGRGDPTVKSDIFSLGVITREMLSGHRPPTEPGEALRPLRELNSAISSEVEAVVQKATKDDPSERYRSVTGFLNALRQAVEKGGGISPTVPSPPTVSLPPSGPLKRPRLPWFIAAGLSVLILAILGKIFLIPPSPPAPGTFCLATDLPLNGIEATGGQGVRQAVELALAQSALPAGYHLTQFDMDDSSPQDGGGANPTVGVGNLQNLSQQTACPNPIAIIGPSDSSVAAEEIAIAAEKHLLLLSPSNTAPCLTQKNWSDPPTCIYDLIHPQGLSNTYARLPGTDINQGYLDADFLLTRHDSANPGQGGLGASRIEIVGDEEVYGSQVAQAVIQELAHKGVKPVGIDCVKSTREYSTNPSCSLNPGIEAFSIDNIAALAKKIQHEHVDAIFFGGLNDGGAGLLRQHLGQLGLDQIPFVGADALVDDAQSFFGTIGSDAANIYATFPAVDPSSFSSGSEAEATFFSQYQKTFGTPPTAYSANGYDAANIIIQSIKDLINAGQQINQASVAQTVLNNDSGKDFTGVAGNRIHFDQNGDNTGSHVYTIYQSQPQPRGTWGWKVLTTQPIV